MVTKLDRPVRREVRIGQTPYVVTLSRDKLRIAVKGRRKGQEALWEELVGAHDAPLPPLQPADTATPRAAPGAGTATPATSREAGGTAPPAHQRGA